jgi:hypothetical protein
MPSKSTKFQSEPKDKPSKAKNLAKVSSVLGIHHSVTLDGKLIVDPKEQLIIRKILKLRQSGISLRAIADELNHQ